MVLFMARPTTRSGSRNAQFRKRVPLPITRGKHVSLSLPPETDGDKPLLAAAVSTGVVLTLRVVERRGS